MARSRVISPLLRCISTSPSLVAVFSYPLTPCFSPLHIQHRVISPLRCLSTSPSPHMAVCSAWDLDNAGIPTFSHPYFAVEAIKSLSPQACHHIIYCCGNLDKIRADYEVILTSLGVELFHKIGKNVADKFLQSLSIKWMDNHPQPGGYQVNLISSNGGLRTLADEALFRGYVTQVAYTRICNPSLYSRSTVTPVNFRRRVYQMMQQPEMVMDFAHWTKIRSGGVF